MVEVSKKNIIGWIIEALEGELRIYDQETSPERYPSPQREGRTVGELIEDIKKTIGDRLGLLMAVVGGEEPEYNLLRKASRGYDSLCDLLEQYDSKDPVASGEVRETYREYGTLLQELKTSIDQIKRFAESGG